MPPEKIQRLCETRVRMKPRPYIRENGRSPSEECSQTPEAHVLGQSEQLDNIRSASCPLHSRTGGRMCAFPDLPLPPSRRGRRLVRPSCVPTPEPLARPHRRELVEEQSRRNSAPHSRLDRRV